LPSGSRRAAETTEALVARYGDRYRWFATVTVMLGTVSAVLSTTTINVAIADIMGAFGIGQDRAQWLSTGALAATTVGMLLNAWLLQRVGQRTTFVGTLGIFVAALFAAGLSPDENVLIVCRLVQGLVAGILQPLSMYVLFQVFPPHRRGTAMGIFGMAVVLAPAFGPTLGGIVIEHLSWRHVFYLAVPSSVVAMLLGLVFMPQREPDAGRAAFDWTGFALLSMTLSCLLIGLSNGQREGWNSDFIVWMLLAAGAGVIAFVGWELSARQPLVELRVLANGQFAAASTVALIFGAGLFGTVYLLPLFSTTVQGFTPYGAGLLLMPAGIVLGLCLPAAGYLSDRLSARLLIMAGLVCFGLSSLLMVRVDVGTPFWTLAWWIVLGRVGLAFIKPALNVSALRALPPEQLSQGAGMINFFRQLGGAFGTNLLSVSLDLRVHFHDDMLAALQTAGNSATMETLRIVQGLLARSGASPDVQAAGAMHYLGRVVHAQASTQGFQDCFLIAAVVFFAALIPAWVMGGGRPRTRPT
jgi:EmrB/QacA subfamily drug resistance transporter